MYLLNVTVDFSEKAIQALDTKIKAKYYFFFFLHGHGVRDLHITITKPLEIWLWILGLHVPRLALIWKQEDIDEKKPQKASWKFHKGNGWYQVQHEFHWIVRSFSKNHTMIALQKHFRQSFCTEEIPSYHYVPILERMTWGLLRFVDKYSRFLFPLSLSY